MTVINWISYSLVLCIFSPSSALASRCVPSIASIVCLFLCSRSCFRRASPSSASFTPPIITAATWAASCTFFFLGAISSKHSTTRLRHYRNIHIIHHSNSSTAIISVCFIPLWNATTRNMVPRRDSTGSFNFIEMATTLLDQKRDEARKDHQADARYSAPLANNN